MWNKRCLILLLLAMPAFAQHDFLTSNEVDQIRDVQEPVARIRLYLLFGKQRLDQLQSTLAKDRPGRSGEVRTLLDEYGQVIEAIDTVADDALARKVDVTLAPTVVVEGETKFLAQLEKVKASAPRDLDAYEFELEEAIVTTTDSIDLAKEDLGARGKEVTSKAEKEKKEVADVNAAERKVTKGDAVADKAEAAAVEAAKPSTRKAPTLYRDGEKPDDSK